MIETLAHFQGLVVEIIEIDNDSAEREIAEINARRASMPRADHSRAHDSAWDALRCCRE